MRQPTRDGSVELPGFQVEGCQGSEQAVAQEPGL